MNDLIINAPVGEFVEVIIPDFVNIDFTEDIGKNWEKTLTLFFINCL